MNKVYLFAYGRLQPQYNPPATATDFEDDAVFGDLYDHGHDPFITNLSGDYTDRITGTLMKIDRRELPYLDREETGYRRVKTETANRKEAYVYVWDGRIPADAKRIKRWPVEK